MRLAWVRLSSAVTTGTGKTLKKPLTELRALLKLFWVYVVHILSIKNSQNLSVKELIYLALQFSLATAWTASMYLL